MDPDPHIPKGFGSRREKFEEKTEKTEKARKLVIIVILWTKCKEIWINSMVSHFWAIFLSFTVTPENSSKGNLYKKISVGSGSATN